MAEGEQVAGSLIIRTRPEPRLRHLPAKNHMAKDEEITIVVNGRQRTVPKNSELTVAQMVALAFDNPPTGENIEFTITYRKGGNENRPEGSMSGGDTVKVKEGTIFNVTATDKS
jgi:hypothetical protein